MRELELELGPEPELVRLALGQLRACPCRAVGRHQGQAFRRALHLQESVGEAGRVTAPRENRRYYNHISR